jgi:RNA polymerase sigma-70 factor (ECF subfamily)
VACARQSPKFAPHQFFETSAPPARTEAVYGANAQELSGLAAMASVVGEGSPGLLPAEENFERQLLVRHRDGDPDAFAELVQRFRAPVFSYLVRCGVEPASRDDLFQEIFIKIHNASARYRAEQPLPPWIFTIAANTVRSHFRKRRVQGLVFPERRSNDPKSESASAQESLEAQETAAWIEAALARLPRKQREVFSLCGVQGLPQQQVSEILGMPLNTVKTQLRRARIELARGLALWRGKAPEEVSS